MSLFVCLLLFLPDERIIVYKDTGIFKRLARAQTAIMGNHVFILNIVDKKICHYLANGKKLPQIGRPGQGPGEFSHPKSIQAFETILYAFDGTRIHAFSMDGVVRDTIKKPSETLFLHKVGNGWLGMSGLYPQSLKKPTELVLFDDNLNQATVLYSWESEWTRNGSDMDGFFMVYVNPARADTFLGLSPDRRFACVTLAGLDELFVIDITRKLLITKIKVKGPSIPFDHEWGERYFSKLNSMLPSSGKVKYKPRFPDYFPIIQSMTISLENHILVTKWVSPSGEGDPFNISSPPPIAFDMNGNPVNPTSVDFSDHRLSALQGEWGYVITTENEAYTLARVPRALIPRYIADHPLPDLLIPAVR